MKKQLKYYSSIYLKFFETSFAEASSFRTSFALIVLMEIIFYLTTLLSVSFIYDHIESIGPWNKNQLLFFISFMIAVDHLHMLIVSENFWELSIKIRTGTLDFDLLRPASSIFTVFFRRVRTASLVNSPLVISMIIYYGIAAELSLLAWILLPPLIFFGFLLLILIEFCISTSMFWLIEGWGVNFLRMQFQQLSRWPSFIYSYYTKKLLTIFVPILLVGSAPVHFLYDFSKYHLVLYLLIAIIIFYFILNFLWKLGLKHYDSPSS